MRVPRRGALPSTTWVFWRASTMAMVMWAIIVCGLLSIVYGALTVRAGTMAADPGTQKMQEIAAAIQEGAQAYLTRQYSTIAIAGAVIFVIVGLLLGWLVALGFLIGAVLSGSAGFIGMLVSVRANRPPRRPRPARWLRASPWRSAPAPSPASWWRAWRCSALPSTSPF